MNDLSYVYLKTVEPSVKKYALCSNPRDGAVSRTYFPPSTYELNRQNEFIHKEISRRAGFQKRRIKTVIDTGLNLDKRNVTSKLPPIRLNERIIDDYEPGKVFKESPASRMLVTQTTGAAQSLALEKASVLKPLNLMGSKIREKSEMQLRFEAEEDYIERVRMSKRLSNIMSHRVERFYYLQGGVAHLSPRSPTRLSTQLGGIPNCSSFDANQQIGMTNYEVQLRGDSRKSPIDRVTRQNESANQNQVTNGENNHPEIQESSVQPPSERVFPVNIEVASGINQEQLNSDLMSTTRSDDKSPHQDENNLPDVPLESSGRDSNQIQDSNDEQMNVNIESSDGDPKIDANGVEGGDSDTVSDANASSGNFGKVTAVGSPDETGNQNTREESGEQMRIGNEGEESVENAEEDKLEEEKSGGDQITDIDAKSEIKENDTDVVVVQDHTFITQPSLTEQS